MAKKQVKKISADQKKEVSTLKLAKDYDIAMDFAQKVLNKIGPPIKSIILFGSSSKEKSAPQSDIDLMIIIDDTTIGWDNEMVAWYREELGKIIQQNPYVKALHVNTVRLTTWWNEMIRGEPVVLNIIRSGLPLIDHGSFFTPLKSLLVQGKIKSTPEMIYVTLGRAPVHLVRSKASMMSAMESVYWSFVDASHAVLIAAKEFPSSPEQIPEIFKSLLVDKSLLNKKYLEWYQEVYTLTHKIFRGELTDISGETVQLWRERADEYLREMSSIVKKLII